MPARKTCSTKTIEKKTPFRIEADKGSEVYVAGTFNGWNPSKDKLAYGKGVFSCSLPLPVGRHEYKFVVDGTWCVDPACPEWAPNGLGSLNSVATVG